MTVLNTADDVKVGASAVSKVYLGTDQVWPSGFDFLSLSPHALFDTSSLALSDGDPVPLWADSSGNGHDAAQATAGFQPTFKTAILNGEDVVRFGGDDKLATAAWASLAQPNTIFLVASLANANDYYMDGIDGSNRHAFFDNGSDQHDQYAGGEVAAAQTRPTGFNYWTLVYNGASSSVRKNGAAFASGDAGSQALTGMTLGDRFTSLGTQLNGDIAFHCLVHGTLATADRDAAEAALASRFGL